MTNRDIFLNRLIAARGAAWRILLIGIAFQMLAFLAYRGVALGWIDGLIDSGLFGDLTRAEWARVALYQALAIKIVNYFVLLAALFLTLWVRGVRRAD